MEKTYVTVVGFNNYYGKEPFKIGSVFTCEKEPDNSYDSEAVKVTCSVIGTVGYIANGVNTKANGTSTAGRIYDKVGDKFSIKVMFTTATKVIAEVVE